MDCKVMISIFYSSCGPYRASLSVRCGQRCTAQLSHDDFKTGSSSTSNSSNLLLRSFRSGLEMKTQCAWDGPDPSAARTSLAKQCKAGSTSLRAGAERSTQTDTWDDLAVAENLTQACSFGSVIRSQCARVRTSVDCPLFMQQMTCAMQGSCSNQLSED